ncbi:FGGY family carbohydrate kinase [Pseudonocardia sp. CA-107938]|uniref:FGGY family carbohydrate kinase n=1 Tax=Pseudonocardia sp. CA-107938 TaxID=3240021 RepID=UPI003D8BC4B7
MTVVCVDAGTSLIKAVRYDATGRELGVERRPTVVRTFADGRSEQDMGEVWAAVVDAVRAVTAGDADSVRAVALTAQGDGAWLVDRGGRPVRPAVLWNDARAASVVERWRADGVLDEAFRRTGSLGNSGLPHAILTVLRETEPDAVAAAHAALTCGGWLFLQLTGVLGVDRSDASAPWIDQRTGTCEPDLVALYGLADLAHLVPPLIEDAGRVQPLTADIGLPPGIPVVLAPYDIATTAIGSGATAPGESVSILGTTLCTETIIRPADAVPGPDAPPTGLTLDLGLPGLALRAFPTLAGTGVVDWLVTLLGLPDAAAVTTLAAQAPAGADGVTVLPYLSPAGERAPFLAPAARGVVAGLSFAHGPAHLARATLEGLAHVVRDCLDAAPAGRPDDPLHLCGGGAASELWAQVIADVTGRTVTRTADSQVGAKGALVVASAALGDHPDLASAASDLVRERDRLAPDPLVRDLHDGRHQEFLDTRAAVVHA